MTTLQFFELINMGSVHSIPLHELELISFLTIPGKNVAIARIVADYFFFGQHLATSGPLTGRLLD